jgi:hypothetical protein
MARDSEVIEDIDYDPVSRDMRVALTTGRVYVYFNVPAEEYEAFRAAASLGRYFNANIRDQYEFREVT